MMRRLLSLAALGSLACTQAQAQEQEIARAVQQVRDGTFNLSFASRPGVCGDGSTFISMGGMDEEGEQRFTTFRQTERGWNTTTGSRVREKNRCEEGPVVVALYVKGGAVVEVESFVGGALPSNARTVSTQNAVTYLLSLAETTGSEDVGKHAILPALLADSVRVAPQLLRIAKNTRADNDVRKSAIFWMSQLRDERPAAVADLKTLLGDDNTAIREQVVFALSQIRTDEAVTELLSVARNDRASKVRKSAIFWLGQAAGDRATAGLKQMVSDDDAEVRKSAVFALSQLPGKASVDALLDVVRTSKDREVKKSALFWLGQKDDPRVLALYEELLLKN